MHYTDADRRRRDTLVALGAPDPAARGGLAGKVRLIDSFSHAVGTARFSRSPDGRGARPRLPLLGARPICYVVDGSFMPTSGGVNPSLTITANALRVAGRIAAAPRRRGRLMCGIAGALAPRRGAPPPAGAAERFAAAMVHRGPDGSRVLLAPGRWRSPTGGCQSSICRRRAASR